MTTIVCIDAEGMVTRRKTLSASGSYEIPQLILPSCAATPPVDIRARVIKSRNDEQAEKGVKRDACVTWRSRGKKVWALAALTAFFPDPEISRRGRRVFGSAERGIYSMTTPNTSDAFGIDMTRLRSPDDGGSFMANIAREYTSPMRCRPSIASWRTDMPPYSTLVTLGSLLSDRTSTSGSAVISTLPSIDHSTHSAPLEDPIDPV